MIFPLLLACLLPPPTGQTSAPIIAITHARIIDGTGGPTIPDGVMLIQRGKILAVGPSSSTAVPNGAVIRDYSGKTIIPGLIDMHVHLDEVISPEAFPLFGVTSVRDVGSRLVTIQRLRSLAAKGNAMPRIFWMGRNIDEGKPSWWGAVAVKDFTEVPALIADMAKQGVDGVKLYVNARPEVALFVINEAHARHLPVTGHLKKTLPSEAARLGIDNLEHVSTLYQEFIANSKTAPFDFKTGMAAAAKVNVKPADIDHLVAVLKKYNVAVTPTLSVSTMPVSGKAHALAVYGDWSGIPAGWIADWAQPYWSFVSTTTWKPTDFAAAKTAYARYQALVRKLHTGGVTIIAGTDTPAPWVLPGSGLIHELELLTECGLTPLQAIHSATGLAAKVLGKPKEVGTLQPGLRADFIVLDADPTTNIHNLRRIREVYVSGVAVDRELLRGSFGSVKAGKR